MPSADTDTDTDPDSEPEIVDEARTALLEAVTVELGDVVVDTHLIPGTDLWVRVATGAWADTADYLRNRQRFRFFDFLSVIDWLPSPYGRSLNAAVDVAVGADAGQSGEGDGPAPGDETVVEGGDPATDEAAPSVGTGAAAHAGGATRFQALARVYSLATKIGITVKADIGDDLALATWTGVYAGADWHEREAYEMFGVRFVGHPGLRKLYLPGDFEGHPMRKDFPLLARLVKPWPGIVDVEPMPEVPDGAPEESGS